MFSIDDWEREGEELRERWLRPGDLKRIEDRVRLNPGKPTDSWLSAEKHLERAIQRAQDADAREIDSLDLLFWLQMLVEYMTDGQYALTPKSGESFSGYLERVEELLDEDAGKDRRIPEYREALGRTTPHVVLLFSRWSEEAARDEAASNLERLLDPYGDPKEAGERIVERLQEGAKRWAGTWLRGHTT